MPFGLLYVAHKSFYAPVSWVESGEEVTLSPRNYVYTVYYQIVFSNYVVLANIITVDDGHTKCRTLTPESGVCIQTLVWLGLGNKNTLIVL